MLNKCRYGLIVLLISGCSDNAIDNFQDQYVRYGDRIEECQNIAKENKNPFPSSAWFNGLSNQDKINTLLYLSAVNSDECSQVERDKMNLLADKLPPDIKSGYIKSGAGEQLEVEHYVSDIDEVEALRRKYSEPFIMSNVANRLGLK